jgi:hypothetical protein
MDGEVGCEWEFQACGGSGTERGDGTVPTTETRVEDVWCHVEEISMWEQRETEGEKQSSL